MTRTNTHSENTRWHAQAQAQPNTFEQARTNENTPKNPNITPYPACPSVRPSVRATGNFDRFGRCQKCTKKGRRSPPMAAGAVSGPLSVSRLPAPEQGGPRNGSGVRLSPMGDGGSARLRPLADSTRRHQASWLVGGAARRERYMSERHI